jgi:hypothetical protein
MRKSGMLAIGASILAIATLAIGQAAIRGHDTNRAGPSAAVGVTTVGERLAKIPGLAGTVVADGRDPRFEHSVDLIIETPKEMQKHNEQFLAHPEWFDGVDIGVGYTGPDVKDQQAQDQADASAPKDAPECATDLATGRDARWVLCEGSGELAAYGVPGPRAEGSPVEMLERSLNVVQDPLSDDLSRLGYRTPGSSLTRMRATVAALDAGRAVVDLAGAVEPASDSEYLDTDVVGYVNALLVTSLQVAGSAQFTLNGSCEAFAAWASVQGCVLTQSDMQRREKSGVEQ